MTLKEKDEKIEKLFKLLLIAQSSIGKMADKMHVIEFESNFESYDEFKMYCQNAKDECAKYEQQVVGAMKIFNSTLKELAED